jgi:hypothetical protein
MWALGRVKVGIWLTLARYFLWHKEINMDFLNHMAAVAFILVGVIWLISIWMRKGIPKENGKSQLLFYLLWPTSPRLE